MKTCITFSMEISKKRAQSLRMRVQNAGLYLEEATVIYGFHIGIGTNRCYVSGQASSQTGQCPGVLCMSIFLKESYSIFWHVAPHNLLFI